MDWKSLAPLIGALAPTAGKIIGGFLPIPFASVIGEQFGNVIARQFGTTTPAATAEAIRSDPEAVAKINAAMEIGKAQINGFVEAEKAALDAVKVGLEQTGQTMRLELAPENRHWFYTGWRPAIGWVFVLFSISFGSMLTLAAAGAALSDNARPLQILTDAWPIFLAYFGTLGLMVGVYIPSRSLDKAKFVDTSTVPAKPAPPAPAPKPVPKPVLPIREPRT